MKGKEIETDTNLLAADISELQNALGRARKQLQEMFEQVNALDAMWDGPANAEFQKQFLNDYENGNELCDTVDDMIQSMLYAKNQYTLCEAEIAGIIAAIKI